MLIAEIIRVVSFIIVTGIVLSVCVQPWKYYVSWASVKVIYLSPAFIYEDIFPKFAGNVYGYKNLSLKNFSLILKKQNGRHS